MKINCLAWYIVLTTTAIILIVYRFNVIITGYEKKNQDLEHKNETLKIALDTSDKMLKKQVNVIKHVNELLQQKQKNDEQIQTDKMQNQETLNCADSLKKKQELLNRIFYETDK